LSSDLSGGILSLMNTLETLSELARAVRDLIRIGVVSEIDTEQAAVSRADRRAGD